MLANHPGNTDGPHDKKANKGFKFLRCAAIPLNTISPNSLLLQVLSALSPAINIKIFDFKRRLCSRLTNRTRTKRPQTTDGCASSVSNLGLATLTAAANTSGDPSLMFILRGKLFGPKGLSYADNDEALWDKLEALRQKLSVTHGLVSVLADPDFATGGPGAPGTFLPGPHHDDE
jgi:hypothetical protein